jgi:hypothetical protein
MGRARLWVQCGSHRGLRIGLVATQPDLSPWSQWVQAQAPAAVAHPCAVHAQQGKGAEQVLQQLDGAVGITLQRGGQVRDDTQVEPEVDDRCNDSGNVKDQRSPRVGGAEGPSARDSAVDSEFSTWLIRESAGTDAHGPGGLTIHGSQARVHSPNGLPPPHP